MKVWIVLETGSGYGPSINIFDSEAKAKEFFERLVSEYSEFEDMTPAEQKEVLDNESLVCDDGNEIVIHESEVQ